VRIELRSSSFFGFSSVSSVPFGSAANASSVGAKTVNGPSPASVSPRPAASTAASRVEKSSFPATTSVIVSVHRVRRRRVVAAARRRDDGEGCDDGECRDQLPAAHRVTPSSYRSIRLAVIRGLLSGGLRNPCAGGPLRAHPA